MRYCLFKNLCILVLAMPLFACSGRVPDTLGISDQGFSPCPSSNNCVSSDAAGTRHSVAPILYQGDHSSTWKKIRAAVERLPRCKVMTVSDDYLHAECHSAIFGFVDDLELNLRTAERMIAVRSASRLGSSDLGVNRRRIEKLRRLFNSQDGDH